MADRRRSEAAGGGWRAARARVSQGMPGPAEIEAAIRAVEHATGGAASFHDWTGQVAAVVGAARCAHRHPHCRLVKAAAGARCTAFDMHACRAHAGAGGGAVWKACHAGLCEALAPLADGPRPIGLLFLGPWRAWAGAGLIDAQAPFHRRPGPEVPALAAGRRGHVLALAGLLAAAVARAAAAAPAADEDRRERIRRLLRTHAAAGLSLRDLATDLGLSPSRAGHLVRELFGATFASLLAGERLALAGELLRDGALDLDTVARRCGFAGRSHLHRRFVAAHGCTPGEWRRRPLG